MRSHRRTIANITINTGTVPADLSGASELLHGILHKAYMLDDVDTLIAEFANSGFNPISADAGHAEHTSIFIADPNLGWLLIRCDQVAVPVH